MPISTQSIHHAHKHEHQRDGAKLIPAKRLCLNFSYALRSPSAFAYAYFQSFNWRAVLSGWLGSFWKHSAITKGKQHGKSAGLFFAWSIPGGLGYDFPGLGLTICSEKSCPASFLDSPRTRAHRESSCASRRTSRVASTIKKQWQRAGNDAHQEEERDREGANTQKSTNQGH